MALGPSRAALALNREVGELQEALLVFLMWALEQYAARAEKGKLSWGRHSRNRTGDLDSQFKGIDAMVPGEMLG